MNRIILFAILSMLFIQCGTDEDCELNKEFTFFNGAKLLICDDISHEELQGIDSTVGKFNLDGSELMNYDIGWSDFIGDLEGNIQTGTSINNTFKYIETDSTLAIQFLVDNGGGPFENITYAFYTRNIDNKDLILDIMKSVETK